jgi:hypothetical protein
MKSNKILSLILLTFLCLTVTAQDDYEAKLLAQFHKISSEEMMGWLQKLCSPEFNGRLTGTKEFIASAEWTASQFREWGVKPAGDNGSYFQWFDWPYTVLANSGSLSLKLPQADGTSIIKSYSYPENYFPGMNSGSGEISSDVVFVGFGVTAPELNYDDYKGIDVKGKIVLVNRDVPPTDPFNPEYAKWVGYCYHQYKLKNAVAHGAKGFIYVDGNLANPNIAYDASIIVCGVGKEPVNDIFSGTKTTNADVISKIRKTMKPASFNTGKVMTITESTTRHDDGKACNVVGLIEGTDPVLKNEVIVIGGHLDAVGNGGKAVNGALDNGSGVIDIMGAAKAMAQSGIQLKRSVIFLLIGGEEVGLIGSKLYANKPAFPKDKTITYINLDMVGNGTGLSVGASAPYKQLLTYFEDANSKYIHRPFSGSAPEPKDFYGRPRSDEFNFSSVGFRTMSIGTTGWCKKVYYHLPGDDPDAVTIDIMEDVAKMIYVALTNMANDSSLNLK